MALHSPLSFCSILYHEQVGIRQKESVRNKGGFTVQQEKINPPFHAFSDKLDARGPGIVLQSIRPAYPGLFLPFCAVWMYSAELQLKSFCDK